ncbi:MAG: nuclear transport factor 2 family protein [SAR86 cluster bacterium]|jgi:hypothetical protein|nr:nuclear transport factor 2 family protein [SAR86 cluster bacterium]
MHPIKKYHELIKTKNIEIYDEILDDEVVFYSPVVHTPQRGKEITKLYLTAAGGVFGTDGRQQSDEKSPTPSKFKYIKEVIGERDAFLEFETTIQGIYINGIDLITWNEKNKITEFKVLIRPLKAVNMLHQMMGSMLEKLNK